MANLSSASFNLISLGLTSFLTLKNCSEALHQLNKTTAAFEELATASSL